MKTRTLFLLLGAVALLGLAALLASRSEERRFGAHSQGPLLPGIQRDQLGKVVIKTRDHEWRLERKEGTWTLAPEGFRADDKGVDEALDKLLAVEKRELASQNPDNHAALEVADGAGDATRVELYTDHSEAAATVYVGKAGGDYRSSFVRLDGQNDVYLAADLLRTGFDRGTRGWRDRTVLKFEPGDARKIELIRGDEHVVLEHHGEGETAEWALKAPREGPAVKWKADAIARTLGSLEADDFPTIDQATAALDSPSARVSVTLADGTTKTLLWGASTANSRTYAMLEGGDTIYEIADGRKTSILPELEDLVPAPTPTPTPEESPLTAPGASPSPAEAQASPD